MAGNASDMNRNILLFRVTGNGKSDLEDVIAGGHDRDPSEKLVFQVGKLADSSLSKKVGI